MLNIKKWFKMVTHLQGYIEITIFGDRPEVDKTPFDNFTILDSQGWKNTDKRDWHIRVIGNPIKLEKTWLSWDGDTFRKGDFYNYGITSKIEETIMTEDIPFE